MPEKKAPKATPKKSQPSKEEVKTYEFDEYGYQLDRREELLRLRGLLEYEGITDISKLDAKLATVNKRIAMMEYANELKG